RDEGDPARREDRGHRAHGDRRQLPRVGWGERVGRALGLRLRPAPGRLDTGGRRRDPARRSVLDLTTATGGRKLHLFAGFSLPEAPGTSHLGYPGEEEMTVDQVRAALRERIARGASLEELDMVVRVTRGLTE